MASDATPQETERLPDLVTDLVEELELHSAEFALDQPEGGTTATCTCGQCPKPCSRP